IGPNGVPAFDTLQKSSFSYRQANFPALSYNYTLQQEGLISNVVCKYDTRSPIVWGRVDASQFAFQYNSTCKGQADVLNGQGVQTILSTNGNSTLMYWACKSPPKSLGEPAYYVYLRGRG